MSWALKGLAGPLKDKTFTLKSGMTMGRQGDIVVPDMKSSSIHARFTEGSDGRWILEDNSSKNGTRIDGQRITRARLSDGLTFYIGDQGFEVVEIKEEITATGVPPPAPAAEARPPRSGTLPPLPEAAPPPPPPPKVQRYWHEILAEFVEKNLDAFEEHTRPVAPLNPALVLEFARGLQVNSRWVLGYGPRKIGPGSLDLPIWEPGAPSICFEVTPSADGIVFKTAHPDLVRVNGQGVDSRVLRVGDTIQINETLIEVDFTE